jgi:nucleoid-associated protein YgaU
MQRSPGGIERYVLGLALLMPLGLALAMVAQIPGVTLASPTGMMRADAGPPLITRRPPSSDAVAAPPTLAPPTATPKPTATPVPATATPRPTATPEKGRTYTVKPGDELKQIAAQYSVNIWKIINTNDIPNPDSLRIGQVLRIPDD